MLANTVECNRAPGTTMDGVKGNVRPYHDGRGTSMDMPITSSMVGEMIIRGSWKTTCRTKTHFKHFSWDFQCDCSVHSVNTFKDTKMSTYWLELPSWRTAQVAQEEQEGEAKICDLVEQEGSHPDNCGRRVGSKPCCHTSVNSGWPDPGTGRQLAWRRPNRNTHCG